MSTTDRPLSRIPVEQMVSEHIVRLGEWLERNYDVVMTAILTTATTWEDASRQIHALSPLADEQTTKWRDLGDELTALYEEES